eukprot:jgi/Chlat1/5237/Chrsp33S05005
MGVVAAAAAAAAVSVRSLLCASNTAASAGLLSPLPVSRHGGGGDVGRLQPALRLRHRRFFALQAAAPWVCRSIASSSDTALLLSSADSSDEQDISNDEEEDDEGDGEANDDDSDYDDSQDEAAKAVLKCQAAGDKKQQALKMALRRNERKKKPRACEFIVAAMDSPGLEEYGTLARLYAHKRLHMAAARLPKMMHDRGITPNRDVYYHCLRACARAARPAAAAALLQDMLHERMVVGAREYNTLLRAASRTDDYSILTQALAADTWLLLMSGRGHPVHELIGGCQAVSRVMPWWEKMWQQGTTFPKPNLESYCVMIVAYGFDGHTKLAERMFNRMIMAGIKPNRRAMFALIEAQTLAGNLAGAFAAWEYGISIRSVVPLPQVVSQRDGILKWDLHGFTPFAACIALLKGLLRLHANLQDPTGVGCVEQQQPRVNQTFTCARLGLPLQAKVEDLSLGNI